MTLYLADASAVEYWRRADPSAKTRARAATPFGQDRETPPFSASDLAALEEAGVGWLSEPIHLLVPDDARERSSTCARIDYRSDPSSSCRAT